MTFVLPAAGRSAQRTEPGSQRRHGPWRRQRRGHGQTSVLPDPLQGRGRGRRVCVHPPGSDVEHVVDPQHPLEVQAQADGVVVRQEALEAGEQVGGCRGDSTRTGSEPEPPPPPANTDANTDHPTKTQRGSGNQLRITGNSQLILDPKDLMVHRCVHVASCERAREPRHLSADSRNALLRF